MCGRTTIKKAAVCADWWRVLAMPSCAVRSTRVLKVSRLYLPSCLWRINHCSTMYLKKATHYRHSTENLLSQCLYPSTSLQSVTGLHDNTHSLVTSSNRSIIWTRKLQYDDSQTISSRWRMRRAHKNETTNKHLQITQQQINNKQTNIYNIHHD